MLVTDTNILLRCSRGRAMERVATLRQRGVRLATTESNADELMRKLIDKLWTPEESAADEVARVLAPFQVIGLEEYAHLKAAALDRLREGGKSDWPALAAAMALDADIWSEDVDFFGVGVPVWTTPNLPFVVAEAA